MASFNFFNALRTIALRDVLKEPSEYHLRHIFRWYSRNFHVPLPEVENLPLEDVLQHFYETKYEDMEEEQREEERKLLLESEEDRQKRLMIEDRDLYDQRVFELEAEEIAKAQQSEEEKGRREGRDEKLIVPDLPPSLSSVNLPTMMPDSMMDPLAPPPVKPGQKLPQGISMNFVSKQELEKLINEADDEDEQMDTTIRGNLPSKKPEGTPALDK